MRLTRCDAAHRKEPVTRIRWQERRVDEKKNANRFLRVDLCSYGTVRHLHDSWWPRCRRKPPGSYSIGQAISLAVQRNSISASVSHSILWTLSVWQPTVYPFLSVPECLGTAAPERVPPRHALSTANQSMLVYSCATVTDTPPFRPPVLTYRLDGSFSARPKGTVSLEEGPGAWFLLRNSSER